MQPSATAQACYTDHDNITAAAEKHLAYNAKRLCIDEGRLRRYQKATEQAQIEGRELSAVLRELAADAERQPTAFKAKAVALLGDQGLECSRWAKDTTVRPPDPKPADSLASYASWTVAKVPPSAGLNHTAPSFHPPPTAAAIQNEMPVSDTLKDATSGPVMTLDSKGNKIGVTGGPPPHLFAKKK